MLLILADSSEFVDQAFQWAENGMKECSLPLEDSIHENANRLGDGEQYREVNYDLCDAE